MVLINRRNGVRYQRALLCPSRMCFFFFFNRGNTEGTKSSKILYLMFVHVFCKFVPGLILWFLDSLWFDDLRAEEIGDRVVLAVM